MDRKHLRPLSDLSFNKPPIKSTQTVKPTILNRKNDGFEKMQEEIENLKKEIQFLRMKTVSVDVSTETDVEVGHHVSTETDVEVGHHVSTETDVEVGRHVSTETDVQVGRDASLETDVRVGRDASLETDVQVGHDASTETDVEVGPDASIETDVEVGRDASIETDVEVGSDGSETQVPTTEPGGEPSQVIKDNAEMIMEKFPFFEIPEAEKFEQILGDATFYKIISLRLATKCGTGGKVPLNVLNSIMSKNLQGQLNWENKGTTIQSFRNILKLINSVGRIGYGTYNDKAANELIKTSLRNARAKKK